MGGNELCRRLGGDPASAFRCDINNLARPEAEPGRSYAAPGGLEEPLRPRQRRTAEAHE
jgi:hypothetical protein